MAGLVPAIDVSMVRREDADARNKSGKRSVAGGMI
jgi:hypothetical protein